MFADSIIKFYFLSLVYCFSIMVCVIEPRLEKIRLNSKGYFVDSNDYVKLFHGFNSVLKSHPFYDEELLNTTKLQMFKNWGINLIRLGVIWSGVKPTELSVNYTYLNQIEMIIDECAKYDIYIIIDMHQDALSTRYGTYDGIPLWLIDKFTRPLKYFQYPWPFEYPPNFEMNNYLTYECASSAQKLYNNVSAAWNYWGDYWELIAQRFVNKLNVIGYELVNEPPPGNYYLNPLYGLPDYSGIHNLTPLYDYLVDRIRKVDSTTLIFFEPVTYGIFYPDITGFTRVPGLITDRTATQKSVLSYHYYCWILQASPQESKMPIWKRILCDKLLLREVIANAKLFNRKYGGGRFLTEFGLCGPDNHTDSINTIECNAVLEECDRNFESWAYWDGYFVDNQGNPIMTQVQSFSRTYPKSTTGIPLNLKFNHITGDFDYTFSLDDKFVVKNVQSKIAEIFIPLSVHYSNGFNIRIEPNVVTYEQNENLIAILFKRTNFTTPLDISVRISRK